MTITTEAIQDSVCRLAQVTHNYGSVRVLKGIDLTLPAGKIIALLGLNGAGKSTLMQILAGYLQPTSGTVDRRGTVGMVHQELSLLPELSLAENVALPRMSDYRRWGLLQWSAIEHDAVKALVMVGLEKLNPLKKVGELSTGEQQLVEIARALLLHPTLLILDEPTSALSRQECLRLFSILKKLTAVGTTILFVSHRLDEVKELADEVVVLRDGIVAAHLTGPLWKTANDLVALMTGETSPLDASKSRNGDTNAPLPESLKNSAPMALTPVLRLQNFSAHDRYSKRTLVQWPAHWQLQEGQVIGIAGLLGSGRSLTLQTLACRLKPAHGGAPVPSHGFAITGICEGIPVGYLHEDRKNAGLFSDLSALENVAVSEKSYSRWRRALVLWPQLKVKAKPSDKAHCLSGGNQQKLLLGRAFLSGAKLLLLDEPTRGVDGHSRLEIYKLMKDFTKQGGSILWTSSDFYELSEHSDSILHIDAGHLRPLPQSLNSGQDITTYVLNHKARGAEHVI